MIPCRNGLSCKGARSQSSSHTSWASKNSPALKCAIPRSNCDPSFAAPIGRIRSEGHWSGHTDARSYQLCILGATVEIRIELANVRLGIVEANGVHVAPADPALARLMDQVCDRRRREFTLESLVEA